MDGVYTVKSIGDETEVTYELTSDVSMPIPKPMLHSAEEGIIKAALQELKEKIEG